MIFKLIEPFELAGVGKNMRKIVLCLLRQPAFGALAERLRQPHGHFVGNPALLIDETPRVVRVTPTAAAAVIVNPEGSMHCTTPPGCGDSSWPLLVSSLVINRRSAGATNCPPGAEMASASNVRLAIFSQPTSGCPGTTGASRTGTRSE